MSDKCFASISYYSVGFAFFFPECFVGDASNVNCMNLLSSRFFFLLLMSFLRDFCPLYDPKVFVILQSRFQGSVLPLRPLACFWYNFVYDARVGSSLIVLKHGYPYMPASSGEKINISPLNGLKILDIVS